MFLKSAQNGVISAPFLKSARYKGRLSEEVHVRGTTVRVFGEVSARDHDSTHACSYRKYLNFPGCRGHNVQ